MDKESDVTFFKTIRRISRIWKLKKKLIIWSSTTLKEWTTDSWNMPSTTNLEEEEIVDAPGNDGNASMP